MQKRQEADFDLRENFKLAKELDDISIRGKLTLAQAETLQQAAKSLRRTTRHLEIWIKHYADQTK